jgi:hypothetical protein
MRYMEGKFGVAMTNSQIEAELRGNFESQVRPPAT